MNIIRISLLAFVLLMALNSCGKAVHPTPFQDVKVSALSDNSIISRSYEIPNGIFRGVLWPLEDRKYFKIWVIVNNKEQFFEISPPPGFVTYKAEVTEAWEIRESKLSGSTVTYLAKKKDGSRNIWGQSKNS